MYYAIYKDVRDGAWRCLHEAGIERLPVDVRRIARKAQARVIENSLVNDLSPGEYGKAYKDKDGWIIIYDDLQPTVVSRYTVAHELGHILLGHELQHLKYAETEEFHQKPKSEQYADQFAIRLLCPTCVLWGLDLHTADEIATICRVPLDVAERRLERMTVLYRRNRFLTSPLERTLYERFKPFISEEMRQRCAKR